MDDTGLEFLKQLLENPSPSGFERPVQDVVRRYAATFADRVTTDVHGNVIAARNLGGHMRVMLAGHCDQIGFLVSYIDPEGFLYVQAIGSWDAQVVVGQRMTVWTTAGPVFGAIARKPLLLQTDEERKQVVRLKDLSLDIGARGQREAAACVQIGDPVTLELGFRKMLNERASSSAMDDKAGLWVAFEALRRTDAVAACAVYAVSTVQEEIGLRGSKTSAFGIDPRLGIAIDACHASDVPGTDKRQEGDICLDGGPVIYRGPNINSWVSKRLIETAEQRAIPIQLAAAGNATRTDANAIQVSRAGVAAGLVGIPTRYMHSPVEVVSLRDMDNAAQLLAGFLSQLAGDEDLTP